jgi:Spy/CpxP family protein refolding chaperone
MFGFGGCPEGPGGGGKFVGPPPFMKHLMGHGMGAGAHCGPGAILQGLDLSDEQVERIAEVKGKSFSKLAHAKIDLFELLKGIFKELSSPTVNRSNVQGIADKIKEHLGQLVDLKVEKMVALAEVLTPEQRKKARVNKIRNFLGIGEGADEE